MRGGNAAHLFGVLLLKYNAFSIRDILPREAVRNDIPQKTSDFIFWPLKLARILLVNSFYPA